MYQIDVLIQGFPGKAVCHGGLGWSTVSLIRGEGRVVLLDVGAFGIRRELSKQLQNRGVSPEDVTDVVLTHAHYDHAVNFTLFPKATVWIGDEELSWAEVQPPGFNPLPELYVRELCRNPRVTRVRAGETLFPGLSAIAAPGHTPGSLVFQLNTIDARLVFTGDAAKNRAELLSMSVDATGDMEQSRASLETIWRIWREQPGTILVPGHDLCMFLDAMGCPQYLDKRRAAITAWFSEELTTETHFDLCQPNEQRLFTGLLETSQFL